MTYDEFRGRILTVLSILLQENLHPRVLDEHTVRRIAGELMQCREAGEAMEVLNRDRQARDGIAAVALDLVSHVKAKEFMQQAYETEQKQGTGGHPFALYLIVLCDNWELLGC